MIRVNAHFEKNNLEALLNRYERAVIPQALPAAINKTMTKARTPSLREIAAETGIKQKFLRKRFRIRRATRRNPTGVIWLGTLPIAATKAGRPRRISGGVKVGRRQFSGAFIATVPSGHTGVFRRVASGNRRTAGRPGTSSPNLPIKEETIDLGDGAALILRKHARRMMTTEFPRIFHNEIKFRASRRSLV